MEKNLEKICMNGLPKVPRKIVEAITMNLFPQIQKVYGVAAIVDIVYNAEVGTYEIYVPEQRVSANSVECTNHTSGIECRVTGKSSDITFSVVEDGEVVEVLEAEFTTDSDWDIFWSALTPEEIADGVYYTWAYTAKMVDASGERLVADR